MKQVMLSGFVAAIFLFNWLSPAQVAAARNMDLTGAVKTAQNLFDKGKTEDAVRNLKEVLKKNPNNHEAYKLLGQIAMSQEDFVQAEQHYQKAASINPQDGNTFYLLGIAYIKLANAQAAMRSLGLATQRDPMNFEAYHQLGNLALTTGDPQRAIDFYNKALAINPDHRPTQQNLSRIATILQQQQQKQTV